ncbi:MAG: 2-oxoacid:acceptor oxidoreductase family protein [Candidatus Berkelbacteria bacterium]|nr:2-oxoacid:acceptor oxidoreductase family protein [Candidatus Berkelbacteria bacterium]
MVKDKITEIRWHGRGGQGIKTASFLLAEAMINCGFFAQGFPEYGPEKSGATVAAYNRLSKTRILTHQSIKNPDVVVLMDPSMISKDGDFKNPLNSIWNMGVTEKTIIIANLPREFPKNNCCMENIYTINATSIARKLIGKPIPNTTLMGMLIRLLKLDYHKLIQSFEDRLAKKLPHKIVEANMKCIEEGYNAV